MKLTSNMKRILSALLVLIMVVSVVPANAVNAADSKTPIDAAVIFTDLHTNKSNYKESTVKGIFSAIKNSGLPVSNVISGGDAFSVNSDSDRTNGKYTGYTGTISGYIRDALGDANMPIHYVWSDHDRYAVQEDGTTLLDKTSRLVYGAGNDGVYGTADDDNYYIYLLSMGDMSTNDRYNAGFSGNRSSKGFTSSVSQAIANFRADTAKLNKDRPLLIVSHQPLLDNRNDNGYAYDWATAINAVAAEMDVAFFFGHNHKYDKASDYYYAKGSTMSVCSDSNGNAKSLKLNFAHICGGYMEPTSTGSYSSSGTRRNVVMAVVIYEDSIQYTTYTSSGVYSGNYALNVTVPREHGHQHSFESVTQGATCTENGSVTKTCVTCGETSTEVIPAVGHSYTCVETGATCEQTGSKVYTCSVCGDSYTEVIPATGNHTYETATVAATCAEDGSVTYTCACGDSYTEVIPATGNHTYETTTVAATCTEDGSETKTCAVCEDTVIVVIPALGHAYQAVVTAPTCTQEGYTTYTCDCGDSYVDNKVAALEHTYEAVVTAPTCAEDGKTVYTCACGDSYTVVIPTTGEHVYESVTVAPTCEDAGSVTYTCGCGDSYTEEIPATGHDHKATVTAPTCEEAGYTTYTCACGDSYVADEVAALGHDYKAVVTAPTCEKEGYTTYTCACGDSYVADEVAALGHDYKVVVTAPTCEKEGYTTYTCACGHSYVADKVAALGHSYTAKEENGYIVYTCQCGHSYSEKLTVELEYVKASSLTENKFVITMTAGGKSYALSHKDNTVSAVQITVSNGVITSEVTEDLVWQYTNGKLCYESNGTTYYLYAGSGAAAGGAGGPGAGGHTGPGGAKAEPKAEAKAAPAGAASLTVSTSESTDVSFSSDKLMVGSSYLKYDKKGIKLDKKGDTVTLFQETEK